MREATLEVIPEYATEFHKYLRDEVMDAARELSEYERAVVKGECAEDAEGQAYRNRTMLEGSKLIAQAEDRRLGDSAIYKGDVRVLSNVLDALLDGSAESLSGVCGVSPVDYSAIPQMLDKVKWLATEGKRIDAIDRELVA